MKVRQQETRCEARGSFNLYIFRPEWMAAHRLWPESVANPDGGIQVESRFDAPAFTYSAKESPIRWIVQPDSVAVECESPISADYCGKSLAKLLKLLPHTPLESVSVTFSFEPTDVDEPFPRFDSFLGLFESWGDYEVSRKGFHAKLQRGPIEYHLLAYDAPRKFIVGDAVLVLDQESDANAAVTHCEGFEDHQHSVQQLIHHYFDAEIEE